MPDTVAVDRSCALDPAALSARQARQFLRDLLLEAGHPDWVEVAELAVSELVTNAVLHAHTAVQVRARAGPHELEVEVADGNPALPRQRSPDGQTTTGRGMELVAAITTAHGVRQKPGDHGKVVWFRIGGEPEAAEPGTERAGSPPAPVGTQMVRLLALPASLWLAAEEHHEALLREFALYRAQHDDGGAGEEEQTRADEARHVLGSAFDPVREWLEQQPQELGPAPLVDLPVRVPPHEADEFGVLQDVLDAGERLAATGRLLVHPGLPEVRAVRDWACEQVVAQLAGSPPAPWTGLGDERMAEGPEHLAAPDLADVRDAAYATCAADHTNRILAASQPLADLVGHPVAELVGRRLVVLMPRRLRDAHVAGFTRYLTTGEGRLLGVPTPLPVLHADGREIRCLVLIEARITDGAELFVARFTPTPD